MSKHGCGCCVLCKIIGVLAVLGALNWGLVGLFEFNAVDYFFGPGSVASRVIYSVIGLAGLALLFSFFTACPYCKRHGECCDKSCSCKRNVDHDVNRDVNRNVDHDDVNRDIENK